MKKTLAIIVAGSMAGSMFGIASPAFAAGENGINCGIPDTNGAPGTGANALSEDSQGGGNPFQPGIGNLAKSFNEGNDFQQPPLLLNFFCTTGNGQKPGHAPPSD